MSQQDKVSSTFHDHILATASELAGVLRPVSERLDEVLKKIEEVKDVESSQDYLAVLRVAELFCAYPGVRLVFEEPWSGGSVSLNVRPHDLVAYADSLRVVNEVRRIRENKSGASEFSKRARKGFVELPNRLSDLIGLIREKQVQLQGGVPNILWFVSRNILFDKQNIRDACWFEREGHLLRPADQVEPTYSMLPDLVGLGWLFDSSRSSTSCTPHCFVLRSNPQVEEFLKRSGVCMGKECLDCAPALPRAHKARVKSEAAQIAPPS